MPTTRFSEALRMDDSLQTKAEKYKKTNVICVKKGNKTVNRDSYADLLLGGRIRKKEKKRV